jgi:uncharacterized protein (TIGR02271 family)
MAKTLIATFGSRSEAEQAVEMLVDEGFERGQIQVRSEMSPSTGTAADEDQSWWEWLFGESEDRTYYTDSLRGGGALLSVTAPDERAERARLLLEGSGADVEASTAEGRTTADRTPRGRDARKQEDVVPVVEERLKVGKRPVARGGVRVYSRVVEHPAEEQVRLRRDRIDVQRRPVDRPVTAGDTAFREDTIEVTESAEEPVVAKEARVVEEIAVRKDVEEHTETVRDKVRRTEVEVQPIGERTSAGRTLYDRHEEDFKQHWATAGAGRPYDECRGAYEYGCELGADARHGGAEWETVEPEARRRWEERNPRTWDRFQGPVRYSWDRARAGTRRAA